MQSSHSPNEKFTDRFFARQPWLAYSILGLNVIVFLVMLKASLLPIRLTLIAGNDHATLINFGAKSNFWLLQQRQWFRLVTPIFIHIGLLHLASNSYALWIVGPIVERLYGSGRFALLYLLTGIAGVAGSVLTRGDVQSPVAGASGALFGLFGALLMVSFKYRHELPTTFRQAFRKGILLVVGFNFLFGLLNNTGWLFGNRFRAVIPFIDLWGHASGLLTGAILAMILPYLPPEKNSHSWLDKLILVICLFIVSYCFLRAYQLRPYFIQR
ncbi:MAG: rhomboid family intramembrane serine protease [Acidobacteria bacterium]|nr:rhomboid family intramembrane serine protease [Acidobacteriota bacterium]